MKTKWLVFLFAQSLSGCTLYNSEHQTHFADAEGRVPEQLFSRLERQAVSKPWALKQLGQPLSVTSLQGAHIYTWALTRQEVSEHSIFLLYNSQHTKTQQSYLHLVFDGNDLVKHWLDRDAQVDTTALLTRRDMQHLAVNSLENTAYTAPESRVTTEIIPTPGTSKKSTSDTNALYDF